MPPAPPRRTLRYWLGLLMCEKRDAAGFKRRHVSTLLDVDPVTIERFEKNLKRTEDVDQVLAAYAQLLGDDEPRDYYLQALALWHCEGDDAAPRLEGDDATRFEAEARLEAQRRRERDQPPAGDQPDAGDGNADR